jgi:uncharacterized BrkB/YihY/UPF0761 family membrane protein
VPAKRYPDTRVPHLREVGALYLPDTDRDKPVPQDDSLKTWRRAAIFWMFTLNVLGIAIFLYLASRLWPSARHTERPMDLFTWDMRALPFLVLGVFANTTAFLLGGWGVWKRRDWRLAFVWFVMSLGWYLAMLLDNFEAVKVPS